MRNPFRRKDKDCYLCDAEDIAQDTRASLAQAEADLADQTMKWADEVADRARSDFNNQVKDWATQVAARDLGQPRMDGKGRLHDQHGRYLPKEVSGG